MKPFYKIKVWFKRRELANKKKNRLKIKTNEYINHIIADFALSDSQCYCMSTYNDDWIALENALDEMGVKFYKKEVDEKFIYNAYIND